MTDFDLIAKKLAFIDTCIADLRRLANVDAIAHDIREQRFVEHTLQLAIQAVIDVASHIVADEHLGEPETNRDLVRLLRGAGWLDDALCDALIGMVGFRNILVYGYANVDLDIVKNTLHHDLGDFDHFCARIRARLVTT